jgi:hypothetical protein
MPPRTGEEYVKQFGEPAQAGTTLGVPAQSDAGIHRDHGHQHCKEASREPGGLGHVEEA